MYICQFCSGETALRRRHLRTDENWVCLNSPAPQWSTALRTDSKTRNLCQSSSPTNACVVETSGAACSIPTSSGCVPSAAAIVCGGSRRMKSQCPQLARSKATRQHRFHATTRRTLVITHILVVHVAGDADSPQSTSLNMSGQAVVLRAELFGGARPE